jgi:predicted RNA-binding Zn ribbon-like protein
MERFGPTRRGGPVFRWLGEPLAIDLANTVMVVRPGETVDLLETPDDLGRWLEAQRDRLGGYGSPTKQLSEIRALRDAVHALFTAVARGESPPRPALESVNAASAAGPVAPQLGAGLELTEASLTPDPFASLAGRLARSAIEIAAASERRPLKICTAPSCGMFFLGSRRWCCAACGNRARAARHYERRRASASRARAPAP